MTADRREALLHRAPIKEEDTHEAVACGSHPAGRPTEARSPEEPLRGCGRKAREPGSCPVPPGRRGGSQGAPPGQAAAERAGGAEGRSGITDGVSTAFLAIGPRISSSAARGSAFLSPTWAKTLRVPHLAGLQGGGRPMIVATYARTARWRAPHFGLRSRLFIPCVVTSDSETGELSAFASGAAAPQLLHPASQPASLLSSSFFTIAAPHRLTGPKLVPLSAKISGSSRGVNSLKLLGTDG